MRYSPETKLFFIFASICLVPSFVFVVFKQNSLAYGLIFVLLIFLIYFKNILFIEKFKKNSILFFSITFFLLTLFCGYNLLAYNIIKPMLSMFWLIIMVITAYQLSKFLINVKVDSIINSILWLILLFLFFGWLKFYYIPEFLGYKIGTKAIFPFSEESHYALALGMFSIVYSFVGQLKWNKFILLNMFILSLSYPSLTLLVFTVIMAVVLVIRFDILKYKFLFLILLLSVVITFIYNIYNFDYFISRLNFRGAHNLTTLVWLQGWELAYLNFVNTNGLGLGFQMLGEQPTIYGTFTDSIKFIYYKSFNTQDGGFFAAKLIAEFGIIGVVIAIYYIFLLIKIFFKIRILYRKKLLTEIEKKVLVKYGFIFSFSVEMFLRGYGYFSPGVFLLMTAFFVTPNNLRGSIAKEDFNDTN